MDIRSFFARRNPGEAAVSSAAAAAGTASPAGHNTAPAVRLSGEGGEPAEPGGAEPSSTCPRRPLPRTREDTVTAEGNAEAGNHHRASGPSQQHTVVGLGDKNSGPSQPVLPEYPKTARRLFYPVLDTLLGECKDRFSAQSLAISKSVDADDHGQLCLLCEKNATCL